jgi:hypothetical protein
MADVKKYNFRTEKAPDGSLRYFVNDTELQDKDAYDRIKAKTNETIDKVMNNQSAEFDASSNKMDADFDKATKGFSKGGQINLSDCKVNTVKKNSSNSRW